MYTHVHCSSRNCSNRRSSGPRSHPRKQQHVRVMGGCLLHHAVSLAGQADKHNNNNKTYIKCPCRMPSITNTPTLLLLNRSGFDISGGLATWFQSIRHGRRWSGELFFWQSQDVRQAFTLLYNVNDGPNSKPSVRKDNPRNVNIYSRSYAKFISYVGQTSLLHSAYSVRHALQYGGGNTYCRRCRLTNSLDFGTNQHRLSST